MKIYTLKTLKDLGHNYGGLDDIKIYNFATLEQAQLKMKEELEKAKQFFLTEYCEEEDIELELQDLYFCASDGEDYLHGEIIETELDLDIYAITTVSVDQYEPAAVSTYFRASKEDADLEYENLRNELYNDKLEEFEEEDDEDQTAQEKLDDFIDDYVQHDYEFQNGNRYFHLVEESGDELVILTEKLDFKEEE